MITALYFIGVITLIISIFAGIFSGSVLVFFISIAAGISSSIVLFALANIIENQENILYKLEHQEETEKQIRMQDRKECPKCNYKYDGDSNSCPHCGYRS
jgi:uncharacterized paraquat-inducible protein A